MIAACAIETISRVEKVFLRVYQGAKNALQQIINNTHRFAANASTLRYNSDNALRELFFLVASISRGFLINLLRMLRDYSIIIYLIKNIRSIIEIIAL